MTPFLLPLMFQIGFGESAFASGLMVLVYMGGNLAMKSVTTPILRRFAFRDVVRINGIVCAAVARRVRLPLAGTCHAGHLRRPLRRRHDAFDAFHVDGHARVRRRRRSPRGRARRRSPPWRSRSPARSAWRSQPLALGFFQALRGGQQLALGDFQRALFAASVLMAVAVIWSQRLPRNAGAGLRKLE